MKKVNHLKRNILDNDLETIKKITNHLIENYFTRALSNTHYPLEDFNRTPLKISHFNKNSRDITKLLKIIDHEILDQAIYKTKEGYLKFVDNGVSSVNVLAGTINSLLNQNLTAHLTDSPSATVIEVNILANLRKLLGYECRSKINAITDIGGYFTSGGMMGNMAALLMARNKLMPNSQQAGLCDVGKYKILVSNFASHYSSWMSAGWLGFGEDNVIQVKTKDFKFDLLELRKTIKKNI